MKLTTKNVMKFLNQSDIAPCKKGMTALKKLLKQKKSMEYVFNRMASMRRAEHEINYARWMCDRLSQDYAVHGKLLGLTFQNFKTLFEMYPEI